MTHGGPRAPWQPARGCQLRDRPQPRPGAAAVDALRVPARATSSRCPSPTTPRPPATWECRLHGSISRLVDGSEPEQKKVEAAAHPLGHAAGAASDGRPGSAARRAPRAAGRAARRDRLTRTRRTKRPPTRYTRAGLFVRSARSGVEHLAVVLHDRRQRRPREVDPAGRCAATRTRRLTGAVRLLVDHRAADVGDVARAEVAHQLERGPGVGDVVGDQHLAARTGRRRSAPAAA